MNTKQIISASIDLTKIDKSKIIEGKKGGKYYQVSIFVDEGADQYGNNVRICDNQTKEQREAKEKLIYLGNGRTVWVPKHSEPTEIERPQNKDDQDLPF